MICFQVILFQIQLIKSQIAFNALNGAIIIEMIQSTKPLKKFLAQVLKSSQS
nr:MAG TPA: hypothetical protein [Caudoviricetes sp.]